MSDKGKEWELTFIEQLQVTEILCELFQLIFIAIVEYKALLFLLKKWAK